MSGNSNAMPDVDTIIAEVKASFAGRTRYDGQARREDEIIIAEIDRLRSEVAFLRREMQRQGVRGADPYHERKATHD